MGANVKKKEFVEEFDLLSDPGLVREFAYIDGKWCAAKNGATLGVYNPASGQQIATVSSLSATESGEAVDAAAKAFPAWSSLLPQERASLISEWGRLMMAHEDDLAVIMTLEQGKPLSEARGEIGYGASFAEFFAEEAKRADIIGVTSHLPNAEIEVWLEPIGVAALVTPWNFPIAMITRKAAAALAVGCTVVVHPSKETPLSALALAELAHRAGIHYFDLTEDVPTRSVQCCYRGTG